MGRGSYTEPETVAEALQQAYAAIKVAVDLERRRPDEDVNAASWVAEVHEFRMVMSGAALMMRSFGLLRYASQVAWSPKGPPEDEPGLKPSELLLRTDNDLQAAHDYLNRAAASLTAARLKLDHFS